MKHFLPFLFFLFVAIFVKAQGYKTFLDEKGNAVDQPKADSYIIVKQLADTVWLMKQYDMRDTIMTSGTYKDKNLQVPDGKFVYYYKLDPKIYGPNYKVKSAKDTLNRIKTDGVYKNGLKDGYWIDYFDGRQKEFVTYYEKGVLNGPYESYNRETNTVMVQGNYVNGERDGEWHLLNPHGEIIQTDIYRRGKMYKSHKSISNYHAPEPTREFYTFMDKRIQKLINDSDVVKISISFTITVDGKLVAPKIVGKGYKEAFDKQLLEMLPSSPLWKPANKGNPGEPVEDSSMVTVEIRNGQIQTTIINYRKDVFYNLTH
ncbi:MAG: Gram-negative bacterial tonB protein [Mucilaginibacter sp.]|nr:Gram-negative bacterial tonB protein [Mucilaginibacter sp.]